MTLPAVPMPVAAEPPSTEPPARSARPLAGVALRIAGGVVAIWAGLLAAVLELIFATWAWEVVKGQPGGLTKGTVGTSLAVGAIAAVVALTVLVGWFAHTVVGTRWAVALPALVWFAVVVAGSVKTTEGDLVLTGDNVIGLGMIVAGAVTFAVLGFRQLVVPPTTS
ncbi:hypothetical protein ABZ671_06295 [Micromonospora sp. NPDC006766]|uniref:hypothetical protein n=1 Tax=Micromonospora sp. NPDC006766 TaxID=3154778 RepID=UPI0033FDCD0C